MKYQEIYEALLEDRDLRPEQFATNRSPRAIEARKVLWCALSQQGWSAGEIAERCGMNKFTVYAGLKDQLAQGKARAFLVFLEASNA